MLDTKTNQCLAYEVRPIPCRTYVNYTDSVVCQKNAMPKETVSFDFLYYSYFEAFNDFLTWLYEDGDTGIVEYPDDIYKQDYLVHWLRS
ncbi:Fe-S-cluster containining protein [Natronobacillus azotifigens]